MPFEEQSVFTLDLKKAQKFAVKFRYPSWVTNGELKIKVNGKEVAIEKDANSYVSIIENGNSGDVISIVLPMHSKTEQLRINQPGFLLCTVRLFGSRYRYSGFKWIES
ncbi:hypothetical protein [Flavobacterium palustre]|uniref:hypothetical protein n=1 Tax=Flavobacterium palustre TaxID=1476463 RepID=UPI003623EBE9